MMQAFKSRYAGTCKKCDLPIKQGDMVTWIRTADPLKKGYIHFECWNKITATTNPLDPNNPFAPAIAPLEPVVIPVVAPAIPAPGFAHHNGPAKPSSDTGVMDLLGEALWTRIESRVKQVESNNDELVANVESQLEAFKAELAETVQSSVAQTITVEVVKPNERTVIIDNAHKQLPYLLNLMSRRKNIYLWDSTGGGKSHAIPQVAEALGLRCASQSYNSQSPDYLITGYNDANGNYVPSLFYDFFKVGGVYTGEELDDGSADLLVTLNVALANHHMTFPNRETVKRHPDFIFVGCGNTAGRGPTPRYPERKPFDAAFANRFIFVQWLYDTGLEERIALSINSNAQPYIKWVRSARETVNSLGLRLELTPRTTFNLAELSTDKTITDDSLVDGILAGLDETAKFKLLENVPFPTR